MFNNPHITEYSGLRNFGSQSLMSLADMRYGGGKKTPFVVFSDPVSYGRGALLFEYIKKMGLGHVQATEARQNPNSNRMLQVYIYHVNDKKLRPWHNRHRALRAVEQGKHVLSGNRGMFHYTPEHNEK